MAAVAAPVPELTEPRPLPILIQQRSRPDPAARWEHLILRLGFISTGVIALHLAGLVWARINFFAHHQFIYIVFAQYFLAFVCLVAGVVTLSPAWTRRVALLIPFVIVFSLSAVAYEEIGVSNKAYLTDTLALSHVAADHLLKGEDPFSLRGPAVMNEAFERFHVPTDSITFRTNGVTIDNLLSWPAGEFLPFVIPSALGLGDMRWLVAAIHICTFAVLWWWAPRALRPVVFVPLLADPYLGIQFSSNGATDAMWLLPVVLSALMLQRGRESLAALLYGLSSGIKQEPWMLAPFLLIWVWNMHTDASFDSRVRAAIKFAVLSAAGFLLLNGPFIVWDLAGWYRGVVFPLRDNLIPWGSGLSMLTQTGVADLPKSFYSLATFGVWGVLTLAYALYFRSLKHLLWIFPGIIMWFSYRSLHIYFVFWMPMLLVALFSWWREQDETGAFTAG